VTKGIIGSVAYMAPEQVRGRRDLDKRVDIYALGILLFELLIGRTPFDAPSDFEVMRMHAEVPMPRVRALRPDVPLQLDDVIQRACAKERDQRFANTEEFLAALEAPPQPRTAPLTAVANAHTVVGSGTMPGSAPTAMPAAIAFDGHIPPERGVTEEGSALPSAPAPAARRSTPLLPIGIVGAVLAAGAAVYFVAAQNGTSAGSTSPASSSTVLPSASSSTVLPSASATTTTTTTPTATTTPTPTPTATATTTPTTTTTATPKSTSSLAALAGPWRSTSNRDYLAVATSSDTVEFRIQKASQHPRQGYDDGDVRFELKAIPGDDEEFAVEDHIRPTPAPGFDYDPRASRDSCVGTWTDVKGRKLVGKVDSKGTLVVDLVQIRTGLDKFKVEGRRITACKDLATAPAELIESRLSRVR
jgi:serine/threonine-protein kinase